MQLLSPLVRHLTSNTIIKISSEIIGRLALFGLLLFSARQLDEASFGFYNYGLAIGFVVAQLADLGLQTMITREVALSSAMHSGNRTQARLLVGQAFRLKLYLALGVTAVLLLIATQQEAGYRLPLLVLGLVQVIQTFLEFAAYVFRGQQQLFTESWLLALGRILTAVFGVMLLRQASQLLPLTLGSLLAIIIVTLLAYHRLGWQWIAPRQPKATIQPTSYQAIFQETLPLGIAIFLSIAYTRLSILLLQPLAGETAVAQFSAAFRLIEPAQIIPASIMAAVFPAYSQALSHHPQQARSLSQMTTLLLAGLGLSAVVVAWLTADWLLPWLYDGRFDNSIPAFRWLSLSIWPAFINYSLTHYLIARGQQRFLSWFTGVMLLLHLGISWILIPKVGILGPAFSLIAAELFLLTSCLVVLAFIPPVFRLTSHDHLD